MKTKLSLIAVACALLGLAGCATPFPAPRDVAHLRLERVDSAAVVVEKIWLERKDGPLVVTGFVLRRLEADDTAQTHLDVTLFDAAGRSLRSVQSQFEPRRIVPRFHRHTDAHYLVALDPLPPDTVRIQVRAHEGPHAAPGA